MWNNDRLYMIKEIISANTNDTEMSRFLYMLSSNIQLPFGNKCLIRFNLDDKNKNS